MLYSTKLQWFKYLSWKLPFGDLSQTYTSIFNPQA